MRFTVWNLLLAAWLLASSFVLAHTAFSQLATWVLAVSVVAATLVSLDRPGARFAVSALAVALAIVPAFAPGMSAKAAANNVVAAAVLFLLSLAHPSPALRSKPSA